MNASFGWDAACGTGNSECGEHIGITDSFKNVSDRNNAFHELKANDETRGNIPVELNEHISTCNHTLITVWVSVVTL